VARAKTTAEVISEEGKKRPVKPTGPPCPKCGQQEGWTGPRYQQGKRVHVLVPHKPSLFRREPVETTESLEWTCVVCGYIRHDICSDRV
jgi:hypothetical protein